MIFFIHNSIVICGFFWYDKAKFFLLDLLINCRSNTVKKPYTRTPKQYDGTQVTSHRIHDILPSVLAKIGDVYKDRPDLVLATWPELIGSQLATMTQAVSFVDGVLVVKVKNSTLHSLLSQNEKPRLLRLLRQKFPRVEIKTITFRMG